LVIQYCYEICNIFWCCSSS